MASLAEFIHQHREAIVQHWLNRLMDSTVPETLEHDQVIDSLRDFLQEITEGIRLGSASEDDRRLRISGTAKGHGAQRFHIGYDLSSVIREYAVLRDVIYDVLDEKGFTPSSIELRALSEYLIDAVADSATQYGLERDRAVAKRTAEHMAFLAHEIRNPLSSALLVFQALEEKGELKPGRAAQNLGRSLRALQDLVSRTLLGSQSLSGAEVKKEPIRIHALIEDVARESEAEREAKGIDLALQLPDREIEMQADRRLLFSALSNLVRNAVKFTPRESAIALRAKATPTRVVIEVEDRCGGLPPGSEEKLFDPFVQVGRDRTGFGLGLAIARQAVDAHDGALRVHSLPGQGCVFVIDLPIAPVEPKRTGDSGIDPFHPRDLKPDLDS